MVDITKLLAEYAVGVKNFAGVNLNGVCWYRANLKAINLQSDNLVGADLIRANFSSAK